jgi:hypothetical protein
LKRRVSFDPSSSAVEPGHRRGYRGETSRRTTLLPHFGRLLPAPSLVSSLHRPLLSSLSSLPLTPVGYCVPRFTPSLPSTRSPHAVRAPLALQPHPARPCGVCVPHVVRTPPAHHPHADRTPSAHRPHTVHTPPAHSYDSCRRASRTSRAGGELARPPCVLLQKLALSFANLACRGRARSHPCARLRLTLTDPKWQAQVAREDGTTPPVLALASLASSPGISFPSLSPTRSITSRFGELSGISSSPAPEPPLSREDRFATLNTHWRDAPVGGLLQGEGGLVLGVVGC